MDSKIIKQSVKNLNINDNIINILISNNIKTISQLCKKSKSDLKQLDLLQNEINKLDIELQLLGFGLKNSL